MFMIKYFLIWLINHVKVKKPVFLSDFYGKYDKGNPFVIKFSLYGKDNIVVKES